MAYCNNCGRESHCGTTLTASEFQFGTNQMPFEAKICSHCVCTECSGKTCHKCRNKALDVKLVDYRNTRDRLRGQVWICSKCTKEE